MSSQDQVMAPSVAVEALRAKVEQALGGYTKFSRDCHLSGEYLASFVMPLFEAALAQQAPEGWQTMDTAPKDETRVDLWVVWPAHGDRPSYQSREPDSYWVDGDWVTGEFSLHMYSAKPYAVAWRHRPVAPHAEVTSDDR